ncbi:hypothetical protein [Halegenticoccus soli]|nr:hypothetical protein [Halegenticoccus soli]
MQAVIETSSPTSADGFAATVRSSKSGVAPGDALAAGTAWRR